LENNLYKMPGKQTALKLQEPRHAVTSDSGSGGKTCQPVASARHGVCPEW